MSISNTSPLAGKIIVLTRSDEQAKDSASLWNETGAELILFPVLEICRPDDWSRFDRLVTEDNFDYIIFTSVNAVKMFCLRVKEKNISFDFSRIHVTAVGAKTSEACRAENIPVSLIPNEFSGTGVVAAFGSLNIAGKRIFIPRSAIAKNEIVEGLVKAGAIVETADVYDVKIPEREKCAEIIKLIQNKPVDFILFTSPSTYYNFVKIVEIKDEPEYFSKVKVAAIGKTTKQAIENRGVKVTVVPEVQTMEGLKDALINYYMAS